MFIAHLASHGYAYKTLGKTASWKDPVSRHFDLDHEIYASTFKDVKAWSQSYNTFDNWVNLNSVMAMSSNLETYMSTVIRLALESDVGVLFGASKKIDGIGIIKHGKLQPFDFNEQIIACTKGEWNGRVSAYKKIFGSAPSVVSNNISHLEKIRRLRNNIGHSFGRDLEKSREHDVIEIAEMEKISRENTIKLQKTIFGVAKAIDEQLLKNHVGEFQPLYFYHNLRPTLKHDDENVLRKAGNHAAVFKKKIGNFGATPVGKKFCRGLIEYYESL